MKSRKPIQDQVIVLTGATSGIGLLTAREAAKKGARIVLAARGEEALQELVEEIYSAGGEAAYAAVDVGTEDGVRTIVEKAIDRFGGFDTWINNASTSIYGGVVEIEIEDHRRLFETNYWGYVYGCRAAMAHFHDRGGGIINIGSVLSDRAIPRQGPYCASKHAVKALTDSLRMEIEEDGLPISVTLIKPAAIDTPYKDHAKNYFDVRPVNPPPVYAPDPVAEAILHCIERPRRHLTVGAGGGMVAVMGKLFPSATDFIMEHTMSRLQKTSEPSRGIEDNALHESGASLEVRGDYEHYVAGSSLWARAMMHPAVTGAALVTLGAGIAGVRAIRKSRRR